MIDDDDDDDDDDGDDDDFLWQPHEAGTTYVALTANICSLLRLLTALWSTSTHRQCTACTAAYNTIFVHTILYYPMIFVQNNDIYSYSVTTFILIIYQFSLSLLLSTPFPSEVKN